MLSINLHVNVTISTEALSSPLTGSPIEAAWAEKKEEARRLAVALSRSSDFDLQKDIEALSGCADFINSFVCPEHGTRRVMGRLCRIRLCPICEWRRARTNQFIITEVIKAMPKKLRLLHLVMTVKNVKAEELPTAIDNLFAGWKRFRRRKVIQNVFLGTVRKLEVNYSPDTGYHPHLHILAVVPPSYFGKYYITYEQYRCMWADALGVDYLPQFSVSAVKPGKGNTDVIGLEVGKYTVKPVVDTSKMEAEVYKTLNGALYGRRCIQYSGLMADIRRSLKDLPADDSEGDELEHLVNCDICGAELLKVVKEWERGRFVEVGTL